MYILPQYLVNEGKEESEGKGKERDKERERNINHSSLVSDTYFPN